MKANKTTNPEKNLYIAVNSILSHTTQTPSPILHHKNLPRTSPPPPRTTPEARQIHLSAVAAAVTTNVNRRHLHFFFFKFTLFTANLLLKIPLLIFFHFQLLNYTWLKLAIDGDGNGRRRLRGRRFGVVSERWRSASPSRCGRCFAAATARTAGDRSPTLGLQRIATFLDLVRLRLVASRTALRRGAVRMRDRLRWSRQREESVRDGLLGGYLKQIYPVMVF
ncbi:RING/U-box superfamily protein [Striga asiatica]|uniref:RING/U-box superfamily protein n=1 Tax=Striga asiatica TaxID=4170 RepID=A0A5A7PF77_STRAF|nr:RING/U-box superfamily protein [Striga asiatica]